MSITGQQLLAARLRLRLSQRDVADHLGIHLSCIRLWEQGIRAVPPARMAALEAVLGDLSNDSVARTCAWCAGEFVSSYAVARFCSDECEQRADEWSSSPREWDGVTQYSTAPPLVKRWRTFCVLCGGDEWLRMTDAQAHAQRPLRACVRCGGMRWLEEDVVSRESARELMVGLSA